MLSNYAAIRREVINIQKARMVGTVSFRALAAMHKKPIKSCRYRDLAPISDTMAVVGSRAVITHENLQYFPEKVRYFELD